MELVLLPGMDGTGLMFGPFVRCLPAGVRRGGRIGLSLIGRACLGRWRSAEMLGLLKADLLSPSHTGPPRPRTLRRGVCRTVRGT